ncbi:recombinase family protein [Agrobacterium pusense]|uniref:recombinase family protein n=1 Tax=Agrobacterium pusense TaxID=648995 RepID=UPI000513261C|nr:recombinase family protein [Agrobacterium pusense]ANV25607.1 resolvase [Rhizobium sp. S41]KGE80218.1 resolvase [Rhizobium sp. H41]QWW77748.1 recombinase family protein [Agrobacterium pusense]
MFIRAYLRASTKDQNADRARDDLFAFAASRNWTIAATYAENESGATLKRPELFRLLGDCRPGDVLLVEQIDRLTRLNAGDWDKLKREIQERHVRIVALDLPTSWSMADSGRDDVQARILDAINAMMLDVLAATARKDYDDRRTRQKQGVKAAQARGAYKGRTANTARNDAIGKMLQQETSWSDIMKATGCSRMTVARLARRLRGEAA